MTDDVDHIPPHLRALVPFDGAGNGTQGLIGLADLVAAGIVPDPNPAASAAWNCRAGCSDTKEA